MSIFSVDLLILRNGYGTPHSEEQIRPEMKAIGAAAGALAILGLGYTAWSYFNPGKQPPATGRASGA